MGKTQKNTTANTDQTSTPAAAVASNGVKVRRTRRSVPRESPSQRSSVHRGVTRHRWTGRYEAHLWDKNCWNESQNKKGRQVYLGAYDDEEAAAHAYDLAALKYWGHETILNFPLQTYQEELKEMEGVSREEYIGSLRRKSSGFSRGVSKYRGVARHHHNGRWEARIGRVFGNKYLYLGTYATQEEAATAYDMAAIEYRGLNAVTNFDLSRYIKWLRPGADGAAPVTSPESDPTILTTTTESSAHCIGANIFHPPQSIADVSQFSQPRTGGTNSSSALGLLLQSAKFKEMLEKTSIAAVSPSSPPDSDSKPSRCSFPEDIQTYFECPDNRNYAEGEDPIFGDLNSFTSSPIFECGLDA